MSAERDYGLLDVLAEHARESPNRLAIVCGDARLDWATLERRVDGAAKRLQDAGVRTGDRIAWYAQNCHLYLETLLAAARLGAIMVPLNWRQTADEVAFVLEDLEAAVVLWQGGELAATVSFLPDSVGAKGTWIRIDEATGPWEATSSMAVEPPRAAAQNAVLMLYTAAFDGRPSGALLSQESLLLQALYGRWFAGTDRNDVYLNAGPLFHVGTLKATLATYVAGGVNVFVPRVDAAVLCQVIDRERCTGAFLQGPTKDAMAEHNADGRYDLSCLRSRPGSEAWNAMVTVASSPIRTGYGQTQLGGAVMFATPDDKGAAGRPAPFVRVRIAGPDGASVPPGEVGELQVRGPCVTTGWFRRPELEQERTVGGWHRTGDLAHQEDDGSLTFVGPARHMIKSAAENIYPAEVERVLAMHASVREAAVIGVPDPRWGQRVVGIVVADGHVEVEELIDHCRRHIASYKKPSTVEFVEALPRTPRGAVDRAAVDAAHGGGGYPGTGGGTR